VHDEDVEGAKPGAEAFSSYLYLYTIGIILGIYIIFFRK
jgi:hypothetical protein